jgi:hypothetical protein
MSVIKFRSLPGTANEAQRRLYCSEHTQPNVPEWDRRLHLNHAHQY